MIIRLRKLAALFGTAGKCSENLHEFGEIRGHFSGPLRAAGACLTGSPEPPSLHTLERTHAFLNKASDAAFETRPLYVFTEYAQETTVPHNYLQKL